MEAGIPPPESPRTQSERPAHDQEPDRGSRLLGVLLALALVFAAIVLVREVLPIGTVPRCDEATAMEHQQAHIECFEGSQTQRVIALSVGWPAVVIAPLAVLTSLFFAATGRLELITLALTGAVILLGALSVVVAAL